VNLPDAAEVKRDNEPYELQTNACGWWDDGNWSTSGCTFTDGACECTHLSFFAAIQLFYECSTLSLVSEELPSLDQIDVLAMDRVRALSLAPVIWTAMALIFFLYACRLDEKHQYHSHVDAIFFVDTPEPPTVSATQKLNEVFFELKHPKTKFAEILKGTDPSMIMVNAVTAAIDPTSAFGPSEDLAVQGPGGLVAGRHKFGAKGQDGAMEQLLDTEKTRSSVSLLRESGGKLKRSNSLLALTSRVNEWQDWTAMELIWMLFNKYQPLLAAQYPSLQLDSKCRAAYSGISVNGMCFINALLYQGLGIPRMPECSDAIELDLIYAVIPLIVKSGVIAILDALLQKEICHEFTEKQRDATLFRWRCAENLVMLLSVTYLLATTAYVCFFLYVIPEYAVWGFLKASALAIFTIEVVKPALIAVFVGSALRSKYGPGLGAHFPHLCDFSYRYVFADADFTHTHWAELTRLMSEPPDDPKDLSSISAMSPVQASVDERTLPPPALDLDEPLRVVGREIPVLDFGEEVWLQKDPETSEGEAIFRALLVGDVGVLRRHVLGIFKRPFVECAAQCDGLPIRPIENGREWVSV
jgi:hypothetical protein